MTDEATTAKGSINVETSREDEEKAALAKLSITMDKRCNFAVSVFIILLGIFVLITARNIRMGLVVDPITPRGWPNMMAVILIVGGVFLAVQQLLNWSKLPGHLVPEEGQEDETGYPISATRAIGIMVLSALWEGFLPSMGYLIITPLYLFACSWVMSVRSWNKVIGFSVIYTISSWVIFGPLLGVRMPLGPFGPLFESLGFYF
jgi:hypothetical protein